LVHLWLSTIEGKGRVSRLVKLLLKLIGSKNRPLLI
jgi:hypothetical protein